MKKLALYLFHRLAAAPSAAGLLIGALFWLAALTPSLIPRDGLIQGAIAGLAFAVGYGLAAGLVALWAWLGLPVLRRACAAAPCRWRLCSPPSSCWPAPSSRAAGRTRSTARSDFPPSRPSGP